MLDEFQAFEARRRRPLGEISENRKRRLKSEKSDSKPAVPKHNGPRIESSDESSNRIPSNGKSNGLARKRLDGEPSKPAFSPSASQLRSFFQKSPSFQIYNDKKHDSEASSKTPSVAQLFSVFRNEPPESASVVGRQRLLSSLTDYNETVRQSNTVIRAACDSAKLQAMSGSNIRHNKCSGHVRVVSAAALSDLLVAAIIGDNESILLMNSSKTSITSGTKLCLGDYKTHHIAGVSTRVYSEWRLVE